MMNIGEIRAKLENCPTPWKLRAGITCYELDCGGNTTVLAIEATDKSIGTTELAAVLDMVEMAPAYIETLLNRIEELALIIVDKEAEIAHLENK